MTNTILITGASSGIGRATARLFQSQGWNVVATMRSPEREADLSDLDRVLVARLDVTDEATVDAAVAQGLDHFGRIDVLLNNAGVGAYGPLEATPMDTVRRQFDTNVLGVLRVTKALIPHFRANRAGLIVNVSSMGGRIAFPLGALYHGTKFAVEGLSEALSFEMAAIGVRVKIVEPGMVRTDFVDRSLVFSNDERLTEYQPLVERLMASTAAGQASGSDPLAVAATILRAATDGSDQLRYVAGSDAEALLARRSAEGDADFQGSLRAMFGL
ncbi:SDR family oxidoreductase [Rubellimicrobium rubrum]|uniref:SDR family oxidoreductase n=1 Tax=Rubellimicrobium rubrum TaxID=2585369 RepID=A0A5C4MRR4_9RHOB|nr:SDR family oxidoreductase [Rubellimicrobium rubrum]TNC47293.1 SDR family oxidoreductase [Rubellimicrobium rubrum]